MLKYHENMSTKDFRISEISLRRVSIEKHDQLMHKVKFFARVLLRAQQIREETSNKQQGFRVRFEIEVPEAVYEYRILNV